MLPRLQLAPIVIDYDVLETTASRDPFDQLAYELIARSGELADQVIDAIARATPGEGLALDDAVLGGLLVRTAKLTRGVFDSTQQDESEAHLPLARSAAETALTLHWMARFADE